jgi:hypothetical protein
MQPGMTGSGRLWLKHQKVWAVFLNALTTAVLKRDTSARL